MGYTLEQSLHARFPYLLGVAGPQCGQHTQCFWQRSEHGVDQTDSDVLDDRHHFHRLLGTAECGTLGGVDC